MLNFLHRLQPPLNKCLPKPIDLLLVQKDFSLTYKLDLQLKLNLLDKFKNNILKKMKYYYYYFFFFKLFLLLFSSFFFYYYYYF